MLFQVFFAVSATFLCESSTKVRTFFICCELFAKLLIVSLFVITRFHLVSRFYFKEVMFGRIIQSVPTIVARKLWNLGPLYQ